MAERPWSSLTRRVPLARRAVTLPAVAGAAGGLIATSVLWAPIAAVTDLVRGDRRLPRVRVLSAATAWAALESVGIGVSGAIWAVGRSDDPGANYALQRWWAARLRQALRLIGDVRVEIEGLDVLTPGPVVLVARHVTIADSLVPLWVVAESGLQPRYVLKRELLIDPCLDIVGNRVPNHFVDRSGDATDAELEALRALAAGMGTKDAAVIFPEGTTASPEGRTRALARIAESDPARAERLAGLTRLSPPRHAGLRAILDGTPDADVVFVDHSGFEPLADLGRATEHIPFSAPVQVRLQRVARSQIPDERDAFKAWLDDAWLALDRRDAVPGALEPGKTREAR